MSTPPSNASPGSIPDQINRADWRSFLLEEDRAVASASWQRSLATGTPYRLQVRVRGSDGVPECVELIAFGHKAGNDAELWLFTALDVNGGVLRRDEDGDIVKWHGVATDIEDRQPAEEALQVLSRDLQESNAKLEEAQRIAHVGYWEWDPLTDRVNWSDETYRIYGLRPQERPMDLATVAEKIHPEDWKRALEQALGGASINVACRLFRPTGEERIAQFQGDVKRDTSG